MISNKENVQPVTNGAKTGMSTHPTVMTKRAMIDMKPPVSIEDSRAMFTNLGMDHGKAKNAYEKVIENLEEIVADLIKRNNFLVRDRETVLRENYELRKKIESLSTVLEMKIRLGSLNETESIDLFEILVESKSFSGDSQEESYNYGEDTGNNILQDNFHIMNHPEFVIASNPLSYNMSHYQQNQISMSNIGKAQTLHAVNLQTPGLPHENIFIQCPSANSEGVIRAFYLTIIQKKQITKIFMKIIDELKHDTTTTIYEPYPTNQFWTDMLCNFLKIIHEGHFESQVQVLEYLKTHKLIDTLLVKSLKSRIEFLFENGVEGLGKSPKLNQIFGALANEFSLRMEVLEGQYNFYTKQIKDENLLLSERASLQISLNNKEQNKFYIREQQPCFIIYERQNSIQIPFFIVVQSQIALSNYEINESNNSGGQNPHSFKYSNENERSLDYKDAQIQYSKGTDQLDGIVSILNDRDMNIFEKEQKKLTRKTKKYNETAQIFICQEPLNSSRYFLNRVASSNFHQNS